tara:strand:- start:574 stop:981 length:408 start_codon:yes stop_codon:yes gene_type:complete
MTIKLCYKTYDWKISNGACRSFKEKTGKDLKGFFASYIVASIKLNKDITIFERCEVFRGLHSVEDACKAMLCVIEAAQDGVSLSEIEDGAERVSWSVNNKPDDLSEPWPIVILHLALDINDYICKNLPVKKKAGT